ncbi:DNA-directed RNA polymerase subunit F [Candidatus Bathyarchaeota archaeon]|nr:DNA-directed RNA polymerase subunit F [Candidatus Bathyarchaeota archaeon]
MPRKIINEENLTISEAKHIVEKTIKNKDEAGELQRRTIDYLMKFVKLDYQQAKKLVKELVKQFKIEEVEAIQIANCMPESVDEIRIILAAKGKIIESEKLKGILNVLSKYRK